MCKDPFHIKITSSWEAQGRFPQFSRTFIAYPLAITAKSLAILG